MTSVRVRSAVIRRRLRVQGHVPAGRFRRDGPPAAWRKRRCIRAAMHPGRAALLLGRIRPICSLVAPAAPAPRRSRRHAGFLHGLPGPATGPAMCGRSVRPARAGRSDEGTRSRRPSGRRPNKHPPRRGGRRSASPTTVTSGSACGPTSPEESAPRYGADSYCEPPAASRSSARWPARMPSMPMFPSWQAYS